MLEVLVRARLLGLEALLAQHELVEVDLVRVEVGPLHARELDLAVHRDAARAAHPGPVHHDRVQAHGRRHAARARDLGAGAHHRERADRHHLVDLLLRQDVLERGRDESGPAVRAVVGADDQVVAVLLEPVLPEHEVLRAEADDPRDAVAGLLEGAELGKHRRNPEAAADEDDVPDDLHVAWHPERPDEVKKRVAFLVRGHHLARRLADRLDDDRHGAPVAVVVGHRQRDTLAPLAQAQHHEVPRLGGAGHVGRIHVPEERRFRKLVAADDLVHGPGFSGSGGPAAMVQTHQPPGRSRYATRAPPAGSGAR